jgi:hypothetical protein
MEDHSYTRSIAAGNLLLAHDIAKCEKNSKRKAKMEKAITGKRDLFQQTFSEKWTAAEWVLGCENVLRNSVYKQDAVTFLIDLAFVNPFAPYELNFAETDLKAALVNIARLVGESAEKVDSLFRTRKDAFKAHRHIAYGKIAVLSTVALVTVATGVWMAAPYIGTAIGSAAGLYGAAATAHGLAILGGGSLAIGGFGMAGGTWLLVGSSVLVVGAGGGAALLAIGAPAAKLELVKLQVTFKEVFLAGTPHLKKADDAIAALSKHREEIEATLEEERTLNEKNAKRVSEIEDTRRALATATKWMEQAKRRST